MKITIIHESGENQPRVDRDVCFEDWLPGNHVTVYSDPVGGPYGSFHIYERKGFRIPKGQENKRRRLVLSISKQTLEAMLEAINRKGDKGNRALRQLKERVEHRKNPVARQISRLEREIRQRDALLKIAQERIDEMERRIAELEGKLHA